MARHLVLISLILLFRCSDDNHADRAIHQPPSRKVATIIMRADKERILKMISNPCDTFSFEFPGLYPILDALPNAFSDSLIMDDHLKASGFVVTSSGHGNWERGPRVMTVELTKGDCNCKIFKIYYYNDTLSDGSMNLRVSEKVVCNAANKAGE